MWNVISVRYGGFQLHEKEKYMKKISFESDYIQGCHEEILKRFLETNYEQVSGYGFDPYCESAKEKIKPACESENSEVFFLTGGTQANQIVIDTMLDSCEAVISAQTGHINGHEAGAIEYTGHKVIEISQTNGKIDIDALEQFLTAFRGDANNQHMAEPKLVYLSHPTEYGTLYTLSELRRISDICKQNELSLYLDGARLGYGLMAKGTDVTLPDLARLCDAFYIGGTKVGALCGEAVVFAEGRTPKKFFTKIKQHGALLAKGRLLGLQFDTLFTDNLYFRISKHAIDMAEKLKELFTTRGFRFFLDSPTNQLFIILENALYQKLSEQVGVGFWERYDDTHTVVRFATSWATRREDVEQLASIFDSLTV